MLTIKVNNPEIEERFFEYAKLKKKSIEDVVIEAMKQFLIKHAKEDEIVYEKKDPLKYIKKASENYIDFSQYNVESFKRIKDPVKWQKNMRNEWDR